MKKALVLTIALIISLFVAVGLTACNDVEFEVKFIVDGEVYDTITTAGNEAIKIPENPTKEDYTFDGWYLDEGVWEKPFTANSLLDAPLSSDMNVYAHWLAVTEPAPDQGTQGGDNNGGTTAPDTHTHSLTHHDRVEATTCTTDGTIEYWHCSGCGKNYSDANAETEVSSVVIPAAHSITHHERVEAGCITDGNIEYWHCSGCGKNYSDANAKNEVSSVAITSAGHAASASSTECTRCGLVSFDGLVFALLSDNTYAVTDYTGSAASVVIPKTYENALVTSISENTFYNCNSLTSITIPSGVTSIGSNAFIYCSSLDKVYISDIAKWCAISFGSSDANPLCYANKLYTVGSDTPITNLTIPEGVTTIPSYAFSSDAITSVTIPSSVTSIGEDAFYWCTSLVGVTFAEGIRLTSISADAFRGCSSLTSITIPKFVTSIGNSAFYGCYKLVEVYNLSSLNITKGSSSYGSLGRYALNVYTPDEGTSKLHTTSDGYIFYEDTDTVYLVAYTGNSATLTLPDKYNGKNYAIYGYAFYYNDNITSVTIGSGVTSIGNSAFRYCSKLMSSITIPNGVNSIGTSAFSDCRSLTSITIPSSVTSIGFEAFYGCTSLDKVYISDIAKWCAISFGGCDANPLYYVEKLYTVGSDTPITNLVIPDGVTSIGDYAFYHCTSLTSITIPSGVNSIGEEAFSGCRSLEEITIPNSVTSIGKGAFFWCTSLTSVTIGSRVTTIGSSAFSACYKLVEVYNLSNLNITNDSSSYGDVGYYALDIYTSAAATSKLHTTSDGYIFYEDTDTVYLVAYTGNSTTLTLPDKYNGKNYAIYGYAFYYNDNITSVTIGSGVTSIGSLAFIGCTSLTSVTFANTDGWWYSYSSTATSGTSISATALANTSTAATYLKSAYSSYYWKRG